MANVQAGPQGPLDRVLVADDSRVFRAVTKFTLEDQGLEVVEAANGRDALRLMGTMRPQLVILDGLMPLMSGFEVLESLRTSAEDYHPVVFMVTAVYKSRRWEANTRKDFQVAEYLEKPLEPDDLMHAISRHFPGFLGPDLGTA